MNFEFEPEKKILRDGYTDIQLKKPALSYIREIRRTLKLRDDRWRLSRGYGGVWWIANLTTGHSVPLPKDYHPRFVNGRLDLPVPIILSGNYVYSIRGRHPCRFVEQSFT